MNSDPAKQKTAGAVFSHAENIIYTLLLFSGIALYAGALAWASLKRHWNFESLEDLTMFDQMLWSVRQGLGLITSVSGNNYLQFPHHFFGEHVSPILYLLAWPAGLTRGPEALLILQALALALAAFPLGRLAAALTNSPRIGLAAAMGWLAQPALWGAALYDFHVEAFEGLFLFGFAWALFRGRWHAALWAVLYAACKEDAPIYLAAVALLLGWKFNRWRLALPVAVAALCYAMAAVLWIGPAFSPTGKHLMAGRLLTPAHCGGLWAWICFVFLQPARWMALTGQLLALGLLPMLGGWLLAPAAMAMGLMWLSGADVQALVMLHYPLTVYPLFFLAVLGSLQHISVFFSAGRHPAVRRMLLAGVVACALIGLPLTWSTQSDRFREIGFGRDGGALAACRAVHSVLAGLPQDQPMSVLPDLSPHMARRQHLNLLMDLHDADWLVLRLDGRDYPFDPLAYYYWLTERLAPQSAYGVYALAGERVVVLRRGHPRDLNRAAYHTTRCLEAEYLCHRIGRATIDFAAQNGFALEAGRHDRQNWVLCGTYLDLPPGRYRVGFRVKAAGLNATNPVALDVTEQSGRVQLGKIICDQPTRGYTWLDLDVIVISGEQVEFRCWKAGDGNFRLDAVRWRKLD